MAQSGDEDRKYYFNTKTGEVEQGKVSNWEYRMGPYDTEDEARHALETAKQRSENWDADDREWNS